jgi:pimeloyl-ACP methyl ester carboxylesterase
MQYAPTRMACLMAKRPYYHTALQWIGAFATRTDGAGGRCHGWEGVLPYAPTLDTQSQTLTLKDGRKLGFAEYGDPGGKPVFWFHGFPDSRLEASFADEAAAEMGVRVICFDRPGYGLSDWRPGRRILDWPETMAEAAAQYGYERVGIVGVSGGGPYAAAVAFKRPELCTTVAIVSGLGPMDVDEAARGMSGLGRMIWRSYRWFPWNAWIAMFFFGLAIRHLPERALEWNLRRLPPADRAILEGNPELRERFREVAREAFRQGTRGPAHDMVLYGSPWGFRIRDIKVPVHVWQGDADTLVPFSMGQYQAKAIPDARAHFYAGEGHFLVVPRVREVLEVVTG